MGVRSDVRKKEQAYEEEKYSAAHRYMLSTICDYDDEYSIQTQEYLKKFSSKEPDNSLNMGDEHLDTIPSTESDEEIKSKGENLVPIPIEVRGYFRRSFTIVIWPMVILATFDPNDDTSSDDDDFEDIEYVSLEEVNDVDQEEKEFNLEDIFQIQDSVLESPSSFPISVVDSDSFLEESDTSLSHLDNSLPEFETFSDHTERRIEWLEGENVVFLNVEEDDSFTFTIRAFLPFVTYPEASFLSCSTGSEDAIFDPGIST
ncbi:hypothetical protein Tco_0072450 [Tanacetum coccineum]